MASAKSIVHTSTLKPNVVSKNLINGAWALRWPEENTKPVAPILVNLHIDSKGYILFCLNKATKEIECFDIALIHDTRTGKYIIPPKDAIKCEQMNIGADVPVQDKWLTIYYGHTFVPDRELRAIHFCFESPSLAKEWADELFQYARNPFLRNLSALELLEKIHSKIVNGLVEEVRQDRQDRKEIAVRTILRMFCRNSRETEREQRILKALDYIQLPHERDSWIDPEQFTFDKFFNFYMQLMERNEIDRLVEKIGGKRNRLITHEKLKAFIEKQSKTRSDDAVYNINYDQKTSDIIRKYTQHDKLFSQNESMCDESFLRYLLSFDNLVIDPSKLELHQDMDKPLSHYFIASSHNTYLVGGQLHGRASVEMYRQVLLTGCRCIELDILDSPDGEPEIKHRKTMIRAVPFRDVIEAIDQYAFKVSPYPVILSFENHCSERVQWKMANYLTEILGDKLLTQPLKSHPNKENVPLPSPNDLKNKILIKNKKLRSIKTPYSIDPNVTVGNPYSTNLQQKRFGKSDSIQTTSSDYSFNSVTQPTSPSGYSSASSAQTFNMSPTNSVRRTGRHFSDVHRHLESIEFDINSESPRYGIIVDPNSDSSDEELFENEHNNLHDQLASNQTYPLTTTVAPVPYLNEVMIESKATKAMSDLVNYVTAVHFKDFVIAEKLDLSHECSSFNEDKGQNLIRENAIEFVNYNKRQWSRIYPKGTRIDSSNYNPYTFWPVGCQMVALNYQTLDTPMQINLGMFEYNKRCGYLQKPAPYCLRSGTFDPHAHVSVENVVVEQLEIKLISGQFLTQDREPAYVDVEMYGIYADTTKRREYRIKSKKWNGFQAVYDDSDVEHDITIKFSKINLPEMAAVRFAAFEEDNIFIGQAVIPVLNLRSGYRHVVLRNQINVPIQSSTLFIFIRIDVHVDDANLDFVKLLMNPKIGEVKKQAFNEILNDQRQPHPNGSDQPNIYDVQIQQILNPLVAKRSKSAGDLRGRLGSVNYELRKDPFGSVANLHHSSITGKRHPSSAIIDENIYKIQFVQNSPLNNKRLCDCLTIKDIYRTKFYMQKQEKLQMKLQKTGTVQDKKIEIEEKKFRKNLHRQKAINEFYNKIEKHINAYYTKQISCVHEIFKQESAKVKDQVRIQTKSDTKERLWNERDRQKLSSVRNKIRQMNVEAGAVTIRKLESMRDKLCETITTNQINTLASLKLERESETKNRSTKYAAPINEIETCLNSEIHSDDNSLNSSMTNSLSLSQNVFITAHSLTSPLSNTLHLQSNPVINQQQQDLFVNTEDASTKL